MLPASPTFTSSDLTASATIAVYRPVDEVVVQEGRSLALFCWRRTPEFEKLLADLAAGRLTPDPAAVERERKALRARAIFVVAASPRGGA